MAAHLQIRHQETAAGVVIITIAGRVMLGDESARIETLVARLLSSGKKRFVFELSGVTHLDSTGIGRFISCMNQLLRQGGKMRMAAASPEVRNAFRVTRLDTVFEFFDDVEAAIQDF